MEHLFIVLSGLVIVIAYVPFIAGTIRGTVVPNRISWMIWFVQDCLMATSAVVGRTGPVAIMPIIWAVGAGIMLVLSFKRGVSEPVTFLEKVCLVLSGLGILLWVTTGSSRLGLVASVSAACIGGIPTTIKAWREPWTETMSGWLLMLAGTILSSLAIQEWTFDSGFLPITIGIFQALVTLPLVLYAVQKSIQIKTFVQ